MKRSAVILARCIAFVETYDLSPVGRVFFPDLVKELVARYQFQNFPKDYSEFDESKGIEFLEGKINNDVIWKLTIYNNGILIDTRSNTDLSQAIIEEALQWAKGKFGLTYNPGMISRFAYVSNLTFYSEVNLAMLHPAVKKLADRITSAVSEIHKETIDYQPTSLILQHDQLKRKSPIAGFTITPRVDTPLSEHKYFSEAPLPTDLHWELLEEFEAAIKK